MRNDKLFDRSPLECIISFYIFFCYDISSKYINLFLFYITQIFKILLKYLLFFNFKLCYHYLMIKFSIREPENKMFLTKRES